VALPNLSVCAFPLCFFCFLNYYSSLLAVISVSVCSRRFQSAVKNIIFITIITIIIIIICHYSGAYLHISQRRGPGSISVQSTWDLLSETCHWYRFRRVTGTGLDVSLVPVFLPVLWSPPPPHQNYHTSTPHSFVHLS